MQNLKVRDLLVFSVAQPRMVRADTSLREVVEMMIADRATREVYLVDKMGRFFGGITLRQLARHVFTRAVPARGSATDMLNLISANTAGDLVLEKAAYVEQDDTLAHVLDVMFRFDVNEIPVVDDQQVVVGSLNMLEMLAAWHDGKLDGPE